MKLLIIPYFTVGTLLMFFTTPSVLWSNNTQDYTVNDLDGEGHKLTDILADLPSNGLLILSFNSVYNDPCEKVIPELLKIANESTHVKLVFIFIDDAKNASSYADKCNINKSIYVDKWSSISSYFKVTSVPSTVILNRSSKILGRFEFHTNENVDLMKKLVAKKY